MPTPNISIKLNPVVSSQIEAIGHDPENMVLGIKFKSGSVYHYEHFSSGDFMDFTEAESVGKHFYKHIKPFPEKYPYRKQ